jgi:penicillin-binding protein 1C
MRSLAPVAQANGGPRIAYPTADAKIEVGPREAVPLSAHGGSGALRWLVDGRPLDGTQWKPDGAGEARVAVVDDQGRSSAVTVRIVRRP